MSQPKISLYRKQKANIVAIFCLFLLFAPLDEVFGQVNIMGKPGLIFTPDATFEKDQAGFTFSNVPEAYAINHFMFDFYEENYFSARAGILPFLEVNFIITRTVGIPDKIGIGDRHLDFRFHLMKEKGNLPSVVLILSPPGGVANFIDHNVLVLTKNYSIAGEWHVSPTLGYGLPYFMGLLPNSESKSLSDRLTFHKKADMENHYLNGLFGGMKLGHSKYGGIMGEYDTRTINVGGFLKLGKNLTFQGHWIDFNKLGFTANFSTPLNSGPYEWRRNEKK